MKMHVLSGGRLRMKKHIYVPDAERSEMIELPVSCFLFRHAQGNVLFDTGCHPSVACDPEQRWGKLARAMTPIMDAEDNVVGDLARIGLDPEDIDVVINSHLHCDHCGCNEYFKNATVIVHSEELKIANNPEFEGAGYFQADWNHETPIVEIDGEHDLFGDGRPVVLPLPGHSPGLVGLLAGSDHEGSFLLASDAVGIRENLDLETVPKNTWDADLLLKSLSEIRRIERSGSTIICGHDDAQWSRLKKREQAYD